MSNVTIFEILTGWRAVTPYNKSFISRARQAGGRWNPSEKAWDFPAEAEDILREICLDVYGESGRGLEETLTVLVEVPADDGWYSDCGESLSIFGRTVARAYGRDSGADVSDGVIVKKGGFDSCGSRKNWRTCAEEGTVFLVKDVPAALVEKYDGDLAIVVVDEAEDKLQKLQERKAKLLAELAKIEAEIH